MSDTPDPAGHPVSMTVTAEMLVEQVTDYAIIALDASGTIQSWNRGAARVKGYERDQVVGRNFSIFYTEEDRDDGLPLRLLGIARQEGSVSHRGWRVRADGSQFWGDVTITALHDDGGRLIGFAKVTRDRTEQHHLEETLRRSEEKFRLLVEQVTDYAIIALDPSGTIETWNAGAERVKGYTAEEAIGRHFSMLYPDEDRRAGLPLELLEQARIRGSVEHTGWRVRKDGGRFYGDVIITALHDQSGRVTGYAKVTRDLTDRHRFEEARDRFLASIAHDFQTPITALAGYAQLLSGADPEQQSQFSERIQRVTGRLQTMAGRLSQRSRETLETGAPVAWLPVAEAVTEALEVIGDAAGIDRVEVDVAAAGVVGDRHETVGILVNLISNALRYSADHQPVFVGAASGDGFTQITVADRGRGIHPDDLETIFDEYQRGRLADPDDGGTGVGLASVRAAVERQGGQVWIDSEPEVGTTVTVRMAGLE